VGFQPEEKYVYETALKNNLESEKCVWRGQI
jgi:hypothetical protein